MTTATFAAKFRSKRGKSSLLLTSLEVFTFLTVDVKAYLPPMNTLTIYFLKALITGEKRRKYPRYELAADSYIDIPMDAVKQVHVPSYENLSLKLVYSFFE